VNKPLLNKSLAVGALVAVAAAGFLVAFTFFKKGGYSEDESYLVRASFSDATGLTWKSRVQIAGIQVGEVAKIELDRDKARLSLRIKKGIDLHTDACLVKSFPSALLPDAQLEASPGSAGAPLLSSLPEAQREVTCIREATSVQALVDSLAKIAADVQLVTGDLAKTVGGPRGSMREIVENLAQLTKRLDATVAANEGRVSSILANVDVITRDVREVTQSEKERVKQIIRNIEELSGELKVTSASVRAILEGTGGAGRAEVGGAGGASGASGASGAGAVAGAGGPGAAGAPVPGGAGAAGGGLAGAAAGPEGRGVKQAVDKLNSNLARLDDLLGKLQEGKSAASRLLVDERMGRQLGNAVEAASEYVDKLDRLQVQVQLRSEWLLNQTGAKTYFGARLLPRPDKYYVFEVVSDPRGVDTITTETVTTNAPDPLDPTRRIESTTVSTKRLHEEKLTFTLQMAKRYGDFTFRVGVIESSGGVGADWHLLDDALQVSVSVYQFSRPSQNPNATLGDVLPRAKVWVNYQFLQHFYVTAGADDFLNQWNSGRYPGGPKFTVGNDVFFGGGLFFTDDDLKTLFGLGAGGALTNLANGNGSSN
jgi:phospholipid/cholesterol/gamma-HCH transport system substrate-binding protein